MSPFLEGLSNLSFEAFFTLLLAYFLHCLPVPHCCDGTCVPLGVCLQLSHSDTHDCMCLTSLQEPQELTSMESLLHPTTPHVASLGYVGLQGSVVLLTSYWSQWHSAMDCSRNGFFVCLQWIVPEIGFLFVCFILLCLVDIWRCLEPLGKVI